MVKPCLFISKIKTLLILNPFKNALCSSLPSPLPLLCSCQVLLGFADSSFSLSVPFPCEVVRSRRSESATCDYQHRSSSLFIVFCLFPDMENLISLVNKIQRACTALGDHGEASALPTLWDSLPAIAVVGGQVTFRSLCTSNLFC